MNYGLPKTKLEVRDVKVKVDGRMWYDMYFHEVGGRHSVFLLLPSGLVQLESNFKESFSAMRSSCVTYLHLGTGARSNNVYNVRALVHDVMRNSSPNFLQS